MSDDFPVHITPDGVPRKLNLIPSPASFRAKFGAGRVIPTSEIRDFQSFPAQVKVKDQGSYGACVGHAAATTIEAVRASAGMSHVPLSAWYVYSILCNGWDRGASIAEALNQVERDGDAPESLVQWGTINPNKLTRGARESAGNYRVEFGSGLTSWEEVESAVALGEYLNLSVRVGDSGNFSRLDPEGVPPVSRGAADHAVTVGGGIKTSRKWGRLLLVRNSWGIRWGLNGCCWLARAHVDNASYFEAYTTRAVRDDPSDTTNPPRPV